MYESIYPSTRGVWFATGVTIFAFIALTGLRWFDVPAGDFIDWGIATAGFWWLLGVVTIPWNIYFGARAVQSEIVLSQGRQLEIGPDDAKFVRVAARRSLAAALLLHLASAGGFAAVAYFGLSPVGWFAAAAALLLTLLRPAARLYRHVASMLHSIGQRTRYPRNDVRTALNRLEDHEFRTKQLELTLDLSDGESWARSMHADLSALRTDLTALKLELATTTQTNEAAHRRLSREGEQAVERLSEDSAFLGNVREIIRFVKHA